MQGVSAPPGSWSAQHTQSMGMVRGGTYLLLQLAGKPSQNKWAGQVNGRFCNESAALTSASCSSFTAALAICSVLLLYVAASTAGLPIWRTSPRRKVRHSMGARLSLRSLQLYMCHCLLRLGV